MKAARISNSLTLSKAHPLRREHFPLGTTSGVTVDTFLQEPADRVPIQAPYPRNLPGQTQLSRHQQLQAIARDAQHIWQASGAGSPLTLMGLAVALRNQASEYEVDAQKQMLEAGSSGAQFQHLGRAVRIGLSEGLLASRKAVGTGVLLGTSLALPYMGLMHDPLQVAASLGVVAYGSLAVGAVMGAVAALEKGKGAFRQTPELEQAAAASKAESGSLLTAADDLEKWNRLLSGPGSPPPDNGPPPFGISN
ncbi:MAG: hypothetical protein U0931_27140 [Vulcanimicrobiota bacterium]